MSVLSRTSPQKFVASLVLSEPVVIKEFVYNKTGELLFIIAMTGVVSELSYCEDVFL